MANSILQKDRYCYLCGKQGILHKHHCLTGIRRETAEEEGLWVWLCPSCHTGSNAIHGNGELLIRLKEKAQREWLYLHDGDMKRWMLLFGKNYLTV